MCDDKKAVLCIRQTRRYKFGTINWMTGSASRVLPAPRTRTLYCTAAPCKQFSAVREAWKTPTSGRTPKSVRTPTVGVNTPSGAGRERGCVRAELLWGRLKTSTGPTMNGCLGATAAAITTAAQLTLLVNWRPLWPETGDRSEISPTRLSTHSFLSLALAAVV